MSPAIDEVEKELGPIRVLVNGQGIVGSQPVLMENYKNFWRTMETNTGSVSTALTKLIQHMISILKVIPLMKARRKGTIICVASRSGTVDLPTTFAYSVSKCAVIRAVGCLRVELDMEGLDIDLYALHPGVFRPTW